MSPYSTVFVIYELKNIQSVSKVANVERMLGHILKISPPLYYGFKINYDLLLRWFSLIKLGLQVGQIKAGSWLSKFF